MSGAKGESDGCILVGVRVRPLGKGRGSATGALGVDCGSGTITVGNRGTSKNLLSAEEKFPFWTVFQPEDNAQIFEEVGRPQVDAVSNGFNATLLTYGQTGAGKTFTMGEISKLETKDEGVAHRMVRDLFTRVEQDKSATYDIRLQYVQIYCEAVHDLLATSPEDAHKPLNLREDKKKGVFVQGCNQLSATTAAEAFALIKRAQENQSFASTKMNEHSSRSHSVCQLFVTRAGGAAVSEAVRPQSAEMETSVAQVTATGGHAEAMAEMRQAAISETANLIQRATASKQTTEGKLTLIDLAGSEDVSRSGAKGKALVEAQKINKSLLALGSVIHSLTHKEKSHAPYRDSALTRMLQQSLGGNCKTTLLCCCSPADGDVVESVSTLRFASRAKLVQNFAKRQAVIEMADNQGAFEELAEKLQSSLDEQAATLTKAHEAAESATARAMQMATRLGRERRADAKKREAEAEKNAAFSEEKMNAAVAAARLDAEVVAAKAEAVAAKAEEAAAMAEEAASKLAAELAEVKAAAAVADEEAKAAAAAAEADAKAAAAAAEAAAKAAAAAADVLASQVASKQAEELKAHQDELNVAKAETAEAASKLAAALSEAALQRSEAAHKHATELKDHKEELEALQAAKDGAAKAYTEELEELKTSKKDAAKAHKEELEALLAAKKDAAKTHKEALGSAREQAEEAASKLKAEVKACQKDLDESQAEGRRSSKKQAAHVAELAEAEERVRSQEAEIKALRAELDAAKADAKLAAEATAVQAAEALKAVEMASVARQQAAEEKATKAELDAARRTLAAEMGAEIRALQAQLAGAHSDAERVAREREVEAAEAAQKARAQSAEMRVLEAELDGAEAGHSAALALAESAKNVTEALEIKISELRQLREEEEVRTANIKAAEVRSLKEVTEGLTSVAQAATAEIRVSEAKRLALALVKDAVQSETERLRSELAKHTTQKRVNSADAMRAIHAMHNGFGGPNNDRGLPKKPTGSTYVKPAGSPRVSSRHDNGMWSP